jgi:thioredoxin 1
MIFFIACGNTTSEKGENSTSLSNSSENIGSTIHLTRSEFIAKVIDYPRGFDKVKYLGDKPCIIDFYADWCGPCKIASPILEEIAKEYSGKIYVYKVNTENERQLSTDLGIQSLPTFVYFPLEGKPFVSSGIGRSKEETKKMFKDIIDRELLKTRK